MELKETVCGKDLNRVIFFLIFFLLFLKIL